MQVEIVWPSLHWYQQQIADDDTRFKFLSCGRRWGKTKGCAIIALRWVVQGYRGWWVAPVYKEAGIAWRDISALAHEINEQFKLAGKPPMFVIQEGAMSVFCGNGFLVCKSSEIPDNLRGEGLDFVIMDEADFQEERTWTAILRPMLTDRKGWAIFISTPNEENGWFHRNYMSGMPGNPPEIPYLNTPYGDRKNYKSWQLSSYTNPLLDDSEIDEAKQDIPSIVFRREYLGEFVSAEGARIQRAWLKDRYFDVLPKHTKLVVGVDLGISEKDSADWTAYVAVGRAPDGQVYVNDAGRMRGSFHEIANAIAAFAESNEVTEIAVEDVQAQKWMVQELSLITNLTVRGVHPDRDIFVRFAPFESRYEQRQIWHRNGLVRAFEAELFSFGSDNLEHDDFEAAMAMTAPLLFKKKSKNMLPNRVVVGGKGYKGI